MQLFLLHFAGGSHRSYDFLKNLFPTDIEFLPLELPGRGKRADEKLIQTMSTAVDDYFEQIKALRKKGPYLIYGHSMGAFLSFKVAERMISHGDSPKSLVLTGHPGPGRFFTGPKKHLLNDSDFKIHLKNLGGIPDEVLYEKELFDFFNPIIRADYKIFEDYIYCTDTDSKLNIPIVALMGDHEEFSKYIQNWQKFTSNKFAYSLLPGNHFFIHSHPEKIANLIKTTFYSM